MMPLHYKATVDKREWEVSSIQVECEWTLKELKKAILSGNDWDVNSTVLFFRTNATKPIPFTTSLGEILTDNSKGSPLSVIVSQGQQKDGSFRQQQPPVSQFSETARAGLELMAEEYLTKKRTIVLSDATFATKTDLMDMLDLPEKGASWPNKPNFSQPIDGYSWLKGDEDSFENRTAYMAYLNKLLQLPEDYALADMQPSRQLLTVELFRQTSESRKIRGTTDVAIARSKHVFNQAVRNNIETLFELKTVNNMLRRDHTPQTVGEHFAASYLNRNHPVVSVLTDLNEKWTFFWFARGEDDSRMALHKLGLDGEQSAAEAKYILDSLYDSSLGDTLPTTFANRQPFQAVLDCVVRNKRPRREFDRDDSDSEDQDSKLSPSGGGSSSTSRGGGHQPHQSSSGGGGAGSTSMASALSLFAPPADRDVANELDLLDMVDENEQYEIVRSFAEKHIVPYMRPVE